MMHNHMHPKGEFSKTTRAWCRARSWVRSSRTRPSRGEKTGGKVMRTSLLLAAMSLLCVPLLSSDPAHAQATRTWVSGVGDDANPCSRTAPCKTFAGAISKTAASGIINCLDPGGFGAVTITKSITIDCTATLAGVLAALTNGINVNGAGANVILRGLDIEGIGSGLIGINFIQGVALQRVQLNKNTEGFRASGAGAGVIFASVQDSMASMNGTNGFVAQGGASVNLDIQRSSSNTNGSDGIRADGAGAVVNIGSSMVTQNTTGLNQVNGGIVKSYGNNAVDANTSNSGGGAPTAPNLTPL